MSDRTPEILEKAAEVIEQRGLAKETYEAPDGRVCTMGALCVAVGLAADAINTDFDPGHQTAIRVVLNAAYALGLCLDDDNLISVTDWNDKPYRTAEEVVAALRGAAAGLKVSV